MWQVGGRVALHATTSSGSAAPTLRAAALAGGVRSDPDPLGQPELGPDVRGWRGAARLSFFARYTPKTRFCSGRQKTSW